MKTLTKLIFGAILAAGAATSINALAQTMADGEVRKVDKDNKKITLKHGEIKDLDMPAMTMVFQVADPSMLDKVKAGDKVQFRATKEGGKYTVTVIQPAK
jgi:Cu/Ag efflux protein CusF